MFLRPPLPPLTVAVPSILNYDINSRHLHIWYCHWNPKEEDLVYGEFLMVVILKNTKSQPQLPFSHEIHTKGTWGKPKWPQTTTGTNVNTCISICQHGSNDFESSLICCVGYTMKSYSISNCITWCMYMHIHVYARMSIQLLCTIPRLDFGNFPFIKADKDYTMSG